MHFLQLTAIIKQGLRSRLQRDSRHNQNEAGVLDNVYNWFVMKPALKQMNFFDDKEFLGELRKELKIFEMCIRIFE